jgi:hypothetical protein
MALEVEGATQTQHSTLGIYCKGSTCIWILIVVSYVPKFWRKILCTFSLAALLARPVGFIWALTRILALS